MIVHIGSKGQIPQIVEIVVRHHTHKDPQSHPTPIHIVLTLIHIHVLLSSVEIVPFTHFVWNTAISGNIWLDFPLCLCNSMSINNNSSAITILLPWTKCITHNNLSVFQVNNENGIVFHNNRLCSGNYISIEVRVQQCCNCGQMFLLSRRNGYILSM